MKAQPPTPAAAAESWSRRRSGVASASRASRIAPLSMGANTPQGALAAPWKYVRSEGHERALHALHARATHARRAAAGESSGQPLVRNVAVAEHAERLAQPAVARQRHRAAEDLAVLDQLDLQVVRIVDEVLDLRAADAGRDVGVGRQRVADRELAARIGRADHDRAGHAGRALQPFQAAAEALDVLRGRDVPVPRRGSPRTRGTSTCARTPAAARRTARAGRSPASLGLLVSSSPLTANQ